MNILEITFTGNVNRLHEALAANVPNFEKVEWDSVNEWNLALPENGQVFSKGTSVWIHYDDDVDVSAIQAEIDALGSN